MVTRGKYRLVAILLSFAILFASNGVHLGAHFCQGKLVSFSVFADIVSCGSCDNNLTQVESTSDSECSHLKRKCCDNRISFSKLTPNTGLHQKNVNQIVKAEFLPNGLFNRVQKLYPGSFTNQVLPPYWEPPDNGQLYLRLEKILV
jgi:hypothetical protein